MTDKPDAKKAAIKACVGLLALADATNQLSGALHDFNTKYITSFQILSKQNTHDIDGSTRKINQDYNEPTERNSNE